MYLCFTLSMSNVGSWNGRWSGESKLYARIEHFGRRKESVAKATEILKRGYYHCSWSDGWSASIKVTEVDRKEAQRIRRKSDGFYGYDWMIQSIIE